MKVRQILHAVEAVLLAGPITGFVAYSFPLAFTIGIASVLSSLMDPRLAVDPLMLAAVAGCGTGTFALAMLWRLIGSTVKNRPLPLGPSFRWALGLGVFAAGCLVALYKWAAVLLAVVPLALLTAHFIYLQLRLQRIEEKGKA